MNIMQSRIKGLGIDNLEMGVCYVPLHIPSFVIICHSWKGRVGRSQASIISCSINCTISYILGTGSNPLMDAEFFHTMHLRIFIFLREWSVKKLQ